jgi:hypothetical protein
MKIMFNDLNQSFELLNSKYECEVRGSVLREITNFIENR